MRTRGWTIRAGVLVCCLGVGVAGASDEAEATGEEPITLAATAVKAGGGVDPQSVEGLDQLVAVEAGRDPRVSVISAADIKAMLGLEAQKQLLQCGDSSSCLTELGGALGVAQLLTTEVTRVGKNWLLYVTLLDVESSRVIAREVRRPEDEDALVDETIEAVRAVVAVLTGAERGGAAAVMTTEPEKPRTSRPLNLRPWVRWGGSALGLGLALTGGLAFYAPGASARADHQDWLDGNAGASPPYTVDQARDLEKKADLGVVLMVSGAVLAAGGWGISALMGEKAPAQAGVILGPEGGAVVVTWRIP